MVLYFLRESVREPSEPAHLPSCSVGWAAGDPFVVREGARAQIAMTNRSMMPHPMHRHRLQ
jgi:FtsP/CotA-like multicopper oxidase with cupredoxin domain